MIDVNEAEGIARPALEKVLRELDERLIHIENEGLVPKDYLFTTYTLGGIIRLVVVVSYDGAFEVKMYVRSGASNEPYRFGVTVVEGTDVKVEYKRLYKQAEDVGQFHKYTLLPHSHHHKVELSLPLEAYSNFPLSMLTEENIAKYIRKYPADNFKGSKTND